MSCIRTTYTTPTRDSYTLLTDTLLTTSDLPTDYLTFYNYYSTLRYI